MSQFISASRSLITVLVVIGMILATANVHSEEALDPLSQRFANADSQANPDFQKHVVPLLGRLGCNGRACHGSFQGRGGFRLSLFGYDFQADHQALLDESTGRIDLEDVDASLILTKPTDADAHEGGKRFELGSWQHHVLRRWIETGASFHPGQLQTLQRLEVTPSEIAFDNADDQVCLTVVAYWDDGTREDVTQLCRFHTNDDAIATIDQTGRVRAAMHGDTHVVVSYDNAVVPIAVIRPLEHDQFLKNAQSNQPIDQIVQAKLNKLRIIPSGQCSDADFVRRLSLDLAGTLPTSQRVREFLADSSPDKRHRLVDELLESPGYAAWWATRFSDWTGNNQDQLNNALPVRNVASRLWYEWLRSRIADNMPYDQIVEGIVTAHSRQGDESYLEYCQAMSQACKPGNESMYAARDGMPLYWSRQDFQKPEDRAIGFAYTFLGVRIECAQCHKHPFDRWSKEDFEGFAKLFSPIRANANTVSPDAEEDRQQMISKITDGQDLKGGKLRRQLYEAAKQGTVVPFSELLINTKAITARARREAKMKGHDQPMRIPSGRILGELTKVSLDNDTRPALMAWLRSPDNPYFAQAIVNRVWTNYFGIGIVDPPDDMNLANPPSNAALLDHLAKEFVRNDYDLKWLHRTIVLNETYQRNADTNTTNAHDRTNFARHIPRRLPAEVLHDATVLATASSAQVAALHDTLDSLAINDSKSRNAKNPDFALTVFGTSIRESNCDCDRSDAPSLLQSIYLRNDSDIHAKLADRNGWVAQACRQLGVAGPTGKESEQRNQKLVKQAKAIRKQLLTRIERFNDLPQERQERQMPELRENYRRITQKMKRLGYQVPKLERLIDHPTDWAMHPTAIESSPEQGSVSREAIDEIVTESYLRTLSRYPDPQEAEIAISYINESKTPAAGIESLMWALLNTKEFIITH